MKKSVLTFAAAALALAACSDVPTELASSEALRASLGQAENQYLVLGRANRLPAAFETQVAAAGGRVVDVIPHIGVAVVQGSAEFAARAGRIVGVEALVPDLVMQWTDPVVARGEASIDALADVDVQGDVSAASHAFNPVNESFYNLQWAPAAMGAPAAWAAGYRGQGARVAILDGGIWDQHVDLRDRIDFARSRTFTTAETNNEWNRDLGTFWHGTHVAGIVAASANGIGTIGIAPEATIIGVKVLHGGTGPWSGVLNGIVYAATPISEGGAGAHIINMSLGGTLDEKDHAIKHAVRDLKAAMDRATTYAWQRGVTVIAAAGNDSINLDVDKELLKLPAMARHVISVSATGPHGWALGATNFERPTYYTDYGKALVSMSAPGGTVGLFAIDGVDRICSRTMVTGQVITHFCETFDLIMAPSRGAPTSISNYSWAQGTSMAAPALAGVAALLVGRNGGPMHPAQVAAALQQASIDHGDPGNDIFHGMGWAQAGAAVLQ